MGPFADVLLPAAAVVERDGRFTDWEGRSQPFHPVRPAPGLAAPDWEILAGPRPRLPATTSGSGRSRTSAPR